MSDIVQKSTEYRIKQIELAEAKYYKTLTSTLDRIEREVVSLANRELPTSNGKLIATAACNSISLPFDVGKSLLAKDTTSLSILSNVEVKVL